MNRAIPKNYIFSNRDLKRLIIPLVIEQFLAIFVGLVDSIMVSSVSEAAVSAVSLIDTLMVLLINVFTALATGGAIVAGQALGRKDPETGCKITEQLVMLSFFVALVIMIGVFVCKWFILHVVFGQIEPDVMENCNTYLVIVATSIPFLALYNAGAGVHRATGDSKTPMCLSLIMNGINLVGNAILIYGLNMGIAGAAIPTAVSRMFAGIMMLYLLKNPQKILHVTSYKKMRPNRELMGQIARVGIPYSMESSLFQLGKVLVFSLVSTFGTTAITANAVCYKMSDFIILGGQAVGFALSSVAAQCVGAGDYEQVRFYTKRLVGYSFAAVWTLNAVVLVSLPLLLKLYHLSPETAELSKHIMYFHAIMVMTVWPLSWTTPNALRAASDTPFCMKVAMGSVIVCRVFFSYLLGKYMNLGVFGIWIAMTLDWAFRALVFTLRFRGTKWYASAENAKKAKLAS